MQVHPPIQTPSMYPNMFEASHWNFPPPIDISRFKLDPTRRKTTPKTAFDFWKYEELRNYMEMYPNITCRDVLQMMHVIWENMSEEEKSPYYEMVRLSENQHFNNEISPIRKPKTELEEQDRDKLTTCEVQLALLPEVKREEVSPEPTEPKRKRSSNGFIYFMSEQRKIEKAKGRSTEATSFSGYCSNLWKSMSEEQRKEYAEKAKPADAERVKKPPNSFILFVNKMRQEHIKEHGFIQDNLQFSKDMGGVWTSMTAENKKVYNEEAKRLLADFMQKNPDILKKHKTGAGSSNKSPKSCSKKQAMEDDHDYQPAKRMKIQMEADFGIYVPNQEPKSFLNL